MNERRENTKGQPTQSISIRANGRMFAWLLGLKEPKFVTGFSGPELDTAMLRGEINARANIAGTILQRNPEFVEL